MAAKIHNVFAYGTLKRGEPNHHWFGREKGGYFKFLCKAKTIEKYPLIIATKHNIPFLLQRPGIGNNVKGEVYEVDDKVLLHLDVLEDHPKFYVREEYQVKCLEWDQSNTKAWIYFIKNFKPNLLNLAMFEDYSSAGTHGLRFVRKLVGDPDYNYKAEILM